MLPSPPPSLAARIWIVESMRARLTEVPSPPPPGEIIPALFHLILASYRISAKPSTLRKSAGLGRYGPKENLTC